MYIIGIEISNYVYQPYYFIQEKVITAVLIPFVIDSLFGESDLEIESDDELSISVADFEDENIVLVMSYT